MRLTIARATKCCSKQMQAWQGFAWRNRSHEKLGKKQEVGSRRTHDLAGAKQFQGATQPTFLRLDPNPIEWRCNKCCRGLSFMTTILSDDPACYHHTSVVRRWQSENGPRSDGQQRTVWSCFSVFDDESIPRLGHAALCCVLYSKLLSIVFVFQE